MNEPHPDGPVAPTTPFLLPPGRLTDRLPLKLDPESGIPLHRQLTDQLAQLIRSGQLAPLTRLPPMRRLASQVGVSLITVRRTHADLEAKGLLVRQRGRGTFVAEGVATIAREHAVDELRSTISAAIDRAYRQGVDHRDIRAVCEVALERREKESELTPPKTETGERQPRGSTTGEV